MIAATRDDALSEVLREVRAIEVSTRRRVEEMLAGQYRSVFRGRGIDFDQVREYVPGDDVRAIDWNVTARTGRPFVKEHVEERQLTLALLVDVSASGELGSGARAKREVAARLASTLAFSAIGNADRVALVLFSDRIERYVPPGKGRRHALRVIREILAVEPRSRGTDIAGALDFFNRVGGKRSVAFLISDFLTTGERPEELERLAHGLALTNARHDLVAVRVLDPREEELPDVGVLTLEDAETGEQIEIDTTSRKVRERFRALSAARREEITAVLRRARVDALHVRTDADAVAALGAFFERRQRRTR